MRLIWKSLWPEFKQHGRKLVLVMLLGVGLAGLKAITPDLTGRMMDAWNQKDSVQAIRLPLYISALWIVANVFRYFHMFWMLYIAELIAVNFRRQLMNKYLTLNLGFFQSFARGSGGLMSRILNDISIIQGGLVRVADMVREPFMVIFCLGYLIWLDWRMVLFIVIGMPLVTAVIRRFAKGLRAHSRASQETMEDLTHTIKESLDGTRIVQSFNLQGEMQRRFEKQVDEFLASRRKIISGEEASGPASEGMVALFAAGLLIYIGQEAIHGRFNPSHFMSFLVAIGLLLDSSKKVQDSFIRLQQCAVALDRLRTILEDKNIVPEVADAQPFPQNFTEIEFRNISFRYEHDDVLKTVNLKIHKGERVALVGSSGAGKSTLINLLPRFFDPTHGKILIGGIPIDEMNLADLRKHIALVSQDVFLFSDSVERNIWSGDFSKPVDGVREAAKLANADVFIARNPEGYQARVGDRGSMFSGGEKQRISIARAIFKDAPILILDEATSALDSESEQEVQKGLEQLLEGRTALIIAHRLSTISNCDRIIVLDKGQIVEQGSHELLMARKGPYFRFSQLQTRL